MNRARLLAAAAALLAALVLARVAFAPAPPATTLALPAPAAPNAPAASLPPPPTALSGPPTAPPGPPSAPAASAPGAPTLGDLRAALADLDAARATAFADPLTADPDVWADRACACHADDARRLRDLARAGLALHGHRVTLDSVTLRRPPTPERAELLVVDRAAAYAAVDARGRPVSRWPATGPRRWYVTLVRVAGHWAFGQIARAP
ncbi:MAG TPA: hypothetical protein VGX28_11335 [Frankiaceae bacterium]|jgi:hypothetical protein|nr:hypothetical protein [Frankiaceae bacterium]